MKAENAMRAVAGFLAASAAICYLVAALAYIATGRPFNGLLCVLAGAVAAWVAWGTKEAE